MTCLRWLGLGALMLALLGLGCGDDDDSPTDAGRGEDAGADAAVSVLDCEGSVDDVYVTPTDLPAFTDEARGEVVRCAKGDPLTADRIQTVAELHEYDGPALTAEAESYYLAFRTPRASGEGGISSAVMFVPPATDAPKPLIVLAHPTSGLDGDCGPSRDDWESDNMQDTMRSFLPLVGNGYPVMMPDYIGLNTEGTHGFLVMDEAAHTVLDSVRAAMQVAPEGTLSGEVFLVGHSQGAHAIMAAQAAQADYAPELNILGIAAYAPPWNDLTEVGLLFAATGEPVDATANFAAMYSIGHSAAYFGEEEAYRPIASDLREQVQALYTENCHNGNAERLAEVASSIGELFSSSFRETVSKCVNLGICDERGDFWVARLTGHRPTLDADGAPVWVHMASLDNRVPYEETVCEMEANQEAGLPVDTCIYDGVTHSEVALEPYPWTLAWIEALLAGEDAPACEQPTFCDAPADGGVADGGAADGGVPDGGMDGGA